MSESKTKIKTKEAKEEKKPTPTWESMHNKPLYLWVVGIFVVGMVFSWWVYFSFLSASWDILSNHFGNGDRTQLVTGGTAATVDTEEEPERSDNERRIDGVRVDPAKASFWPYAVMMENLYSVRPQSGLSQASVVYEALVEGGATRFMAVFDPSVTVPEIMPVRSARPYYLEWASEYGALYAHAGGSPKALTVLWENPDIMDLEALSRDAQYFWRDTTKYAPHNLVTSSEKMNFALRDKGLRDKEADFPTWTFKDDAPMEERGADGKTVSFNFSYGSTYQVDFTYQRALNQYARFNANEVHIDKNTGEQITAKNVIIQLTEEPVLSGGKGRLDIFVGGTGDAWIFRDGLAIPATWEKESRTDRTRYYDADGEEIPLNRGATWVHILTKTQDVLYE